MDAMLMLDVCPVEYNNSSGKKLWSLLFGQNLLPAVLMLPMDNLSLLDFHLQDPL